MKSWLKRYWLPGILTVVGIVAVLIAVGTATIWAPPSTITAHTKSKSSEQLVATDSGLLSLYNSDVKIKVTGGGKVALAIGHSSDINGWLLKQPHLSVTGLESYTSLKTKLIAGTDKVLPPDANNAIDMWYFYKASDRDSLSYTWKQEDGNWSLLAWSEKGPVEVTLQWHQEYSNPVFYPLLAVGILLILVGAVIAIVLHRIAQATQRELEESQAKRELLEKIRNFQLESDSSPQSIPIAAVPEGKQRPSRKSLREAREHGEETINVDGIEYSTGLLPIIKLDDAGIPINPADSEVTSEKLDPQTSSSDSSEKSAEEKTDEK